jgi:hypothetical protein
MDAGGATDHPFGQPEGDGHGLEDAAQCGRSHHAFGIALRYYTCTEGSFTDWGELRLEEPWVRVAPGLWLGRRPLAGELPPEVSLVVDLTGEWHRAAGVRELPHHGLICLDGMPFPDLDALRRLVDEVTPDPRPTYVHCAAGHGRSALVVAALMVRRGLAATPEEAQARLKALRPRVHITRGQWAQLVAVSSGLPPGP